MKAPTCIASLLCSASLAAHADSAPATAAPTAPEANAPAAVPAPALQSSVAAAPAQAPKSERNVYLSFSPVHLAISSLEVAAERGFSKNFGATLIAGAGVPKVDGRTYVMSSLGAQATYYALGDFHHGLQLTGELMYTSIKLDKGLAGEENIRATGSALSLAPLVGYKYESPLGLTFNVQAGAAYMVALATAENTAVLPSSKSVASGSASGFVPVLNANVGWSF